MDVRIYAFELTPPHAVPIKEFLDFLHEKSAEEYRGYLIPTTTKDGFYAGLALEPKDMKSFCKFRKAGKKFSIKSEELEQGTNLADFNFFLVNPATGRGLYSHYHRSTSLHEFCWLMQKRWLDYKNAARKEKIAALPDDHKKQDEVAITKKYSGYLKYSPIFRPSTFKDRVAALSSVLEFDFTLTSYTAVVGDFKPMDGSVERVSAGFRFSQDASIDQLKGLITSFVSKRSPKSAKVTGVDSSGTEVIYKLFNDLDVFENINFDHFIANLDIDSNDLDGTLQKSAVVAALLKLANDQPAKAMLSAAAK